MEFKEMKTEELLNLYADILEELNERHVIRTHNSPVGDYAEWLVSKCMGLTLAPNSEKGFDASGKGIRYQIKSRWVREDSGPQGRQLNVIRNYEDNQFDYLVAMIFDRRFHVKEAYQIPHELIKEYGRYSKHQNGYLLTIYGAILHDARVKHIKHIFA